MIEDFANLIPKGLLNKSGAAFHSSRDAFEGDSPLYVLGLTVQRAGGSGDPEGIRTPVARMKSR